MIIEFLSEPASRIRLDRSINRESDKQIFYVVFHAGHEWIPDPMNGERFIKMPRTQPSEIQPFIESLKSTPKSGLHNPIKSPERYLLYGEVSKKAANALSDPKVGLVSALVFVCRCIDSQSMTLDCLCLSLSLCVYLYGCVDSSSPHLR